MSLKTEFELLNTMTMRCVNQTSIPFKYANIYYNIDASLKNGYGGIIWNGWRRIKLCLNKENEGITWS